MELEGIGKLYEALSKAQGEMEGAKKDAANPYFRSKYADLASVWDACRGPLSKHGLAVIQRPSCKFIGEPKPYTWVAKSGEEREGVHMPTEVMVTTTLTHSAGGTVEGVLSCMLADADPQKVGSAITYLRRYALQALVGIAPEDDDGEAATDHAAPAREYRPASGGKTTVPPCPKHGNTKDVIASKKKAGSFYCFPCKYDWTPEGPIETTASQAEELFK
jgi:hypothetical protein